MSTSDTAPPAANISVVICAYTLNRWGAIQRAVQSVLAQERPALEVILVIDHNPQLLSRAEACWRREEGDGPTPEVRVVANAGSQGLSGARNTGVELARSEIVAFLDDDAEAESTWIERLLAPYADPWVVACGGAAVAALDVPRPLWWPVEFDWVVGCSWRGLPTVSAEVRNLIGANMSVRRDAAVAAGGFPEGIGRMGLNPVGCEETDLCIRLVQLSPGARILYEPSARVHHTVPADRLSWRYFRSRCFAEGMSKAKVAARVGAGKALASERSYTLHVLPQGMGRGLLGACRGERGAGRRAMAIGAGLTITTAGYVRGRLAASQALDAGDVMPSAPAKGMPVAAAGPVWVAQVELSDSLSAVGVSRPQGPDDVGARLLVRLHHQLLGFVSIPLTGGDLTGDAVAAAVQTELRKPLQEHLEADGMALPPVLPGTGVGHGEPCALVFARHGPHQPYSVVVCTRDRPAILATCLKLLQQLHYPAFEVVVVDNAPTTADTHECFIRLVGDDPRFRYVREPLPGLSRARNRGLREASARRVAFTDDDVQVDPRWLHGISAGFDRDPGAGCVTGLAAPAELDHASQHYFDRRYSWASHMESRVFDLDSSRDPSPLYPYSAGIFGTGANFAVDRELFEGLGGFDEALGAGSPAGGGEDLDAFVRVLLAGRSLVYEPSAIVWHVHRAEPRALRRQIFFYGCGLTAFLGKHLADRRTAGDILIRLPDGARRVSRSWDPGQIGGKAPAVLMVAEALGMAAGPLAYARGRRWLTRTRTAPSREDFLHRAESGPADEALAYGSGHCLQTGVGTQLVEDALGVVPQGVGRDEQGLSDGPAGGAGGHELEHLQLAGREVGPDPPGAVTESGQQAPQHVRGDQGLS